MKCFSFLRAVLLLSLFACGVSFAQPWLTVKNSPPGNGVYLPYLLTDGTVIFQGYPDLSAWYKLTPDNTGSYVNGTWTQIASLPPGYQPFAFGSAVLADGRFVIVGGEDNSINGIDDNNTSHAAIYDPKSDTWTPLSRPPFAVDQAADCPTVVLPSGQFVVGDENSSALAFLDPVTLTWTIPSASGSNTDTFVEAGFTLLPDGSFLVVDVQGAPLTQRYVPSLQRWIGAGSTKPSLQEYYEMGPAILRPDGTVFATGASGSNAVYTPPSTLTGAGTWKVAPSFPNDPVLGQYDTADAPASLLPDGNVLVEASPGWDMYGIHMYEFDGTHLTQVDDPPGAANDTSQDGSLLPLPNGQTLFQQGNTYFYTNGGSPNPAWAPTISQFPAVVGPGGTYPIFGTQFNGLSQASAYGDDYQAATNWPLVRITNQATGHVFYARTHDHSTMGVATGITPVSTYFDVPPSIELGASNLVVVANGIPSTPVSFTIEKLKSSSVNLVSSLNPSAGGQPVTFTATVSGTGSTPSGTMTFLDGITRLGTGTVDANGVATLSTSALIVETHAITASYSGDSTFSPSTSSALTQTVTGATPTVSLTFTPNPSTFGANVAFTATITGTAGVPTGVVMFYDGTIWLRSEPLVAGVATFSWPNFTADSHSLTAHYLGDTKYAPAISSVVTPTVNPATSTTTVTSSPNPSMPGQQVTFTITVFASGPLAGTVNLYDGNTLLASLDVNSATFQVSTLSAGPHSIKAQFQGTSNQLASSSGVLTQTVSSKPSSVALTSASNPSAYGSPVVFSAIVTSSAGGSPTGTVTFMDGTTTLGTSTVSSGVATLSVSSLSVGSHSIMAQYNGDSVYIASAWSSVSQAVNPGASTVSLSSSLNPSVSSSPVTFTATVNHNGVATPTGNVTFYDGTTSLGSSTLSTAGAATFSVSGLSVGSHAIKAVYSGDGNYLTASSSSVSQGVNPGPSIVILSSSLNPSVLSNTVTFTATVSGPGVGAPTGTVTFADGTTTLGTANLSGGSATLSVSSLSVGTHAIKAVYSGDAANGGGTSGAFSQSVNRSTSSVALSSSLSPSTYGQAVVFTAAVTGAGSGSPTGTVTFMDGTTTLGTSTLSGGSVTLSVSSLSGGLHSITAQYNGDGNYAASASSALSQSVGRGVSTVLLSSSLNPSTTSKIVTFSVTVTGTSVGIPAGSVAFYDGATLLGTSTLTGTGVAVFSLSSLGVGAHSIQASYNGDTNYLGGNSSVLTENVSARPSTTLLSSSVSPSAYGQQVIFTATVTSSVSGIPTRSVVFFDGSTVLGSVTLNAQGVATLAVDNLSLGSHSIKAQYNGAPTYLGSTSNTISQVVTVAPTTVSLSHVFNSAVPDQVTFTARVESIPGQNATGTVTFSTGTLTSAPVSLNKHTAAELTVTLPWVGTYPVTAQYSGDATHSGSTSGIDNVVIDSVP